MKRKVGGWVLFGFGIVLIGTGISSCFDYEFGDIRGIIESLICVIPGAFAIWGGWRLAHPKH